MWYKWESFWMKYNCCYFWGYNFFLIIKRLWFLRFLESLKYIFFVCFFGLRTNYFFFLVMSLAPEENRMISSLINGSVFLRQRLPIYILLHSFRRNSSRNVLLPLLVSLADNALKHTSVSFFLRWEYFLRCLPRFPFSVSFVILPLTDKVFFCRCHVVLVRWVKGSNASLSNHIADAGAFFLIWQRRERTGIDRWEFRGKFRFPRRLLTYVVGMLRIRKFDSMNGHFFYLILVVFFLRKK